MEKIYNNILELVGNTPIVKLNKIKAKFNLNNNILAKIEYFNPAGSIKDRISKFILEEALKNKQINNDTVLIEATSGNTGIGLAMVCALYNLKLIIVMPENMSKERMKLLKIYGTQLILTPTDKGMKGAIDKANELSKKYKNSYIIDQFNNVNNSITHYKYTAKEIWKATNGNINAIVIGIGTGGTISGITKYLKEKNKNILSIGVEPYESPYLTKKLSGLHKIQGIGAGFEPKILEKDLIDKIITIKSNDALYYTKVLCKEEGIFAGISSGAALCGTIQVAKENKNLDNIITIFPDTGSRYLSTELFE